MPSVGQFDRFLTVEESAQRSDRLPDVKNRNPPVANPDGPFEKPRPHGGNLDRTWVPREDASRRDNYAVTARPSVGLRNSHLQLSTLHVSKSLLLALSAVRTRQWGYFRIYAVAVLWFASGGNAASMWPTRALTIAADSAQHIA